MVSDIHAKFRNQPFIMRRAIWRHVFGQTQKTQICFQFHLVTGSSPKFDTLLASWYPTYMQSFIISHSSYAEQYGDMSSNRLTHSLTESHTQKNTKFKKNVIGSLGHHQNLTHCWHHGTRHTYMQSFIISHSSCAELYGDMSSDRLTHN